MLLSAGVWLYWPRRKPTSEPKRAVARTSVSKLQAQRIASGSAVSRDGQ